jgi:antitoxin (DNA-binding transcriptional repressor) of toxin-antitoxin stability system
MRTIDVNELLLTLDEVLVAAKNGETTTVTEHGQPIMLVTPPLIKTVERPRLK